MKRICLILVIAVMVVSGCAHQAGNHASQSGGEFELLSTSNGFTWSAMRYNSSTGGTWFHYPYQWRVINEVGAIAPSKFVVRMIGFGGSHWVAIRLDVLSGRCWTISDSTWEEITKNLPIESTKGAYDLEMVSTGDSWKAIRYDKRSGESWLLFEDGWQLLPERETPARSRYRVRMVGENGWVATRLDQVSGRFWILETINEEHVWVKMDMNVRSDINRGGGND